MQLFLSEHHCRHSPNSPQRWWKCGPQLSAWSSLEETGSVTFLICCVVYPKKENGDPKNRRLFPYKHIYCQRLCCVQRMKSVSFYPSVPAAPLPQCKGCVCFLCCPIFSKPRESPRQHDQGAFAGRIPPTPRHKRCRYQGRWHANRKV